MTGSANILLVHGSCWADVISLLQQRALHVTAVQLPLTSLADDAATVKRALAHEDGPVVLVGHSYGGVVITETGTDPKVASLVYVAAFAPDIGQSAGTLLAAAPPAPLGSELRLDSEGFIKVTEAGIMECFAQDLPDAKKRLLFAAQALTSALSLGGAVSNAAWKSKPSWYIVIQNDRAILPSLQHDMAAKIGAKTTSVESSHVPMLAHPAEVAAQILAAVA